MILSSKELKMRTWQVYRQRDHVILGTVKARCVESALNRAVEIFGKEHGALTVVVVGLPCSFCEGTGSAYGTTCEVCEGTGRG